MSTTGTLSADIQRYNRQRALNTENYLFRLSPRYRMEYGRFQLNAVYRRDTTLQNELEVTGLVLERRKQSHLTINPLWSGSITEHLSMEFAYRFARADLPQGERPGLFEFRNHEETVHLSYHLTERNQLNTILSYATFRVPSFGFRSDTYSAQLGMSHQFSETFQTFFLVGGFYTLQKGSGIKDRREGLSFSGSTNKQFKKTQVSASIGRSLNPSSSGSLLQGDRFSISLLRQFPGDLNTSISASFSKNEFLRQDEGRRKSRFYRISPELRWGWSEQLQIAVSYSYSRQKSDGGFGSVSANTAALTLSYQFKNRVFSP